MSTNSPSPQAVSLREETARAIYEAAPTRVLHPEPAYNLSWDEVQVESPERVRRAYRDADAAIAAWNRRASPPDGVVVPRATPDMLKAMVHYWQSLPGQIPFDSLPPGAMDTLIGKAMFTWEAALAASPALAATSGGGEAWTNEEIEDLISDAIGDSMDMDWTYRDGAKAVLAALHKEGFLRFDLPSPPPADADKLREVERKLERLQVAFPKAVGNGIGRGMMVAAAMIAPNDPVVAEQILNEAGMTTEKALRDADVMDYDIRKLRPVLRNIAERTAK